MDDQKYAKFLNGRIISAFGVEHCYFTPTKEAAQVGGAIDVPTLQIIGDQDQYFAKTNSVRTCLNEPAEIFELTRTFGGNFCCLFHVVITSSQRRVKPLFPRLSPMCLRCRGCVVGVACTGGCGGGERSGVRFLQSQLERPRVRDFRGTGFEDSLYRSDGGRKARRNNHPR